MIYLKYQKQGLRWSNIKFKKKSNATHERIKKRKPPKHFIEF